MLFKVLLAISLLESRKEASIEANLNYCPVQKLIRGIILRRKIFLLTKLVILSNYFYHKGLSYMQTNHASIFAEK